MSLREINQRITELLPKTRYMHMKSDADRDALFRLRYEAYLKAGAILPNNLGRLHDKFDDLANAFNIGVSVEGRLIGAIRVCVWSGQFSFETTPGIEVFREELTPYLTEDAVLIDPNRFVIDTPFTRSEQEFTFLTMRIPFMACIKFNATIAIVTARSEHCDFYRLSFGHQQLTEPRHYPSLIKPLALLVNDFPATRQRIVARFPTFGPLGDDLEQVFDSIVSKQQPTQ